MSWVEYIDSPKFERNDDGFYHATRTFKVWNYARATIEFRPSTVQNSSGIPLLDADDLRLNYIEIPFGGGDDIPLFAYDMTLDPRSLVNIVEVRYTNDIRLLSKPYGQDVMGRAPKGRSGAFQSSFETVPIMLRVPMSIDPGTGQATSTGFEERQWPVPTQKNRFVYSMLLGQDHLFNYRRTVGQFLGKIVDFGEDEGLKDYLLFEGFDYAHHSPTFLLCSLFFLYDPGIVALNTPTTANRLMPPQDKPWPQNPGVMYVRPPYQQIQMVRNAAGDPVWQTLDWHPYDPLGGPSLLNIDRP